jgi:hypothetical protein
VGLLSLMVLGAIEGSGAQGRSITKTPRINAYHRIPDTSGVSVFVGGQWSCAFRERSKDLVEMLVIKEMSLNYLGILACTYLSNIFYSICVQLCIQ